MADGILTPAQSVLGAIQALFLVQPLGTSKIGSSFAPIVIVWLGFNMSFGIYVILTTVQPTVSTRS
ncbi:hypothetical protein FGG08_000578 [Glutinoglossum americanum]|uniref:K+ potassium transporter integral membrane domain-containing protein n=1 Tax=Glutinoglossum americanum TaxID=1670608 RepID=A0A9P8L5Y7_9PEZI|nr:hypothetical protein FGG08_000578 [Glutinoglossum americanum]